MNSRDQLLDPLYPIGESREENILIEFQGILHSEAEEIFYGLQGCGCLSLESFNQYHELLAEYNRLKMLDAAEARMYIYKEISFFRPRDLLRYLNDGKSLDDRLNRYSREQYALDYCCRNYDYRISTLTSLAGALIPLMSEDVIKHMTVLFPPNPGWRALAYLDQLYTPEIIKEKVYFALREENESPADAMFNIMEQCVDSNPFTTIVTNEASLIQRCLRAHTRFGDQGQFYLLRNHSENVRMVVDGENHVRFEEQGTKDIEDLILPKKDRLINGLPLPLMVKFARFSPTPYQRQGGHLNGNA